MKDPQSEQQLQQVVARLKALRKAKGYSNYEPFAYEHNIGRVQYGRVDPDTCKIPVAQIWA